MMLAPAELLARFGGVARGVLLQQYGCSRRVLADAAARGTIRRVRPGVFALPTTDRKVVTAAAHGGELTCADALRANRVWVLSDPDDVVHVWLGRAGRRHPHDRCACVVHHSPGTSGVGYASVATALIHAYRCLPAEEFFAAYESAWNRRLLTASDRRRIATELPQAAQWMLRFARSDAQSGLESLLRFRLHLLGIRLECQVQIGQVGRVDFVAGGRLILEVDGRENHHSAERRHSDLVRDAASSALGYETLRFDYSLVVHHWDQVVPAIIAAIGRIGD
ncbi:endonuclease domain-containing protein [Microbacterium sp. OR16]|uniref:endonuclease domain-containing protein n=1 Tax=Microbacterium sp. OR16 TaxID=3095345 RepID=UPI0039B40783